MRSVVVAVEQYEVSTFCAKECKSTKITIHLKNTTVISRNIKPHKSFTVVGDSEGEMEDAASVGSAEGDTLGDGGGDREREREGKSSKAIDKRF